MILLNILVLVFEILYYSMFMYYAKGEGEFKRYLLLFSLITIIGTFIKTDYLLSYIYLVLMIIIGIKLIVRCKTYFYDYFIIFLMLFLSFLIPIPFVYFIYYTFANVMLTSFIGIIAKLLIIFILRNKIKKNIKKFEIKWNKNIFLIRYVFVIIMLICVISFAIYML